MKGAFLAFLGDVERAAEVLVAAERCGLSAIDLSPGRLVFASEGLSAQRGADERIILGDCFERLTASEDLREGRWGDYVIFSSRDAAWHVERAALTGMPVYWCRHPAGILCASDSGMLQTLAGEPAIDWAFVASALAYINLRTDRTGLSGIRELLAGTSLAFDGAKVTVAQTWSPWRHVAGARSQSVADLARELERRIIACTAAWSQSRRGILVELSGGLDSSIVTAALQAAGADFTAINFATPDAEGDERVYARAVAACCGIALLEVEHDDLAVDLITCPASMSARPGAYSLLGGLDRAFAEAVPGLDRPIFGGIGGDSVFQFDTTVAPILDAFGRFGLSRRTLATARDVARASGATLWEAMRLSWRAHRAGPRFGWRRDLSFLKEAAMPDHPPAHPWDEGAAEVSQAKRNHVESIRRILDFLDRPGRWAGRDVVAPLLSQPVVELCLSVLSDYWFTGGRNRAVARAAFASRLPAEIVWRQGKGRMEALCAAAYLRQRHQLRDLLLGGRLAERGMLDRLAIEAYLKRELADGEFDYFRLIEIGDVERWVRAVEAGVPFGSSFAHR